MVDRTAVGAENRPLLVAIVNAYRDWRSGNPEGTPDPSPGGAELLSINPVTAVKGGPDLTLHAIGQGFVKGYHVINFNGGDERTTWVSATELTTVVKPSLVTVAPFAAPVRVSGAEGQKTFNFTAA